MMKKLSHPFIAELKRCVANQNTTLGPIIISLSELIKLKDSNFTSTEVCRKQKKLSEVTDMIHAAHVFHRCVRDNNCDTITTTTNTSSATANKRLHQDNIMSLLIGDYLLAQSSVDMADLRYPKTVGLIARGLEDYTRGEFLKLQLFESLEKGSEIKSKLKEKIERYAELTCGSLLSNACLSAALLAGYPDRTPSNDLNSSSSSSFNQNNLSNLIYSFGFHTGSAHRLIEFLYCPDTNSEDDKIFIETLDVKQYEESIRGHVDKSIDLLHSLSNASQSNSESSESDQSSRSKLLTMLNEMKNRCQNS